MPTFATAPRVRDSLKKPYPNENPGDPTPRNGAPRHLYISPALYVTPEQAPIPESPSPGPVSPSPYVANHKRRRGKIETGASEFADLASGNDGEDLNLEEAVGDNFGSEDLNENGDYKDDDDDDDDDDEEEGFLDPRSELGSEVEANDLGVGSQMEGRSLVSAQGDFFDAIDDFSSDCSNSNVPSCSSRVESELHMVKLSIADEIEGRRAAEEKLMLMRSQWERVCSLMSEAGLTFPAPPASDYMQLENDSMDQVSQEVVVSRFVAEAIGRGQARAEAEEAAAVVIESKEQELLRLRDRLQYYETVNHELSRRKLVEVAQRQQLRRQHRRWLWGFMGLSIAIGASFLAYSYIPHTGRFLSSPDSGDATDTSQISCSDTP